MTGLLLLSGGQSRRMGVPKHALPHPEGGTWGGHLVRVFRTVCPEGPVVVLGEPLSDWPLLPRLDDPREGPAVALRTWCATQAPREDRWWVVACDQVRWTPDRLAAWLRRVEAEDPDAAHWVMAEHGGRLQPLGSVLPGGLRSALTASDERSLSRLARSVPHRVIPTEGPEWQDLDTPEERRAFESGL